MTLPENQRNSIIVLRDEVLSHVNTGCYGSPCRNFKHKEDLSKESRFLFTIFSENVL
jgi:hypothetical protein